MAAALLRTFVRWLRRSSHPVRKVSLCLCMECLEDRLAPTVNNWTGAADGANWNTAGNWSQGVPQTGQDLVFPSVASGKNTITYNGAAITLNSISFSGSGYQIEGTSTIDFAPTSGDTTACGITTTNTSSISGTANTIYLPLDFTNTAATTITSGVNALTGSQVATSLTLDGSITINGSLRVNGYSNTNFGLQSAIIGSSNLIKGGAGVLDLEAPNPNYTGNTLVNQGTLILSSTSGPCIPGSLTIGTGSGSGAAVQFNVGATGSAPVASNDIQIPTTATITVNSDGTLNLNNWNNTVGPLALNGGLVETSSGILTLGGDVTAADGYTSTITGHIDLGNGTVNSNNQAVRTFDVVGPDEGYVDLWVTATIASTTNPNVELLKTGVGWMQLQPQKANGTNANNTYTGPTVVNSGTLDLETAHALGNTTSVTVNSFSSQDPGTLYIYNGTAGSTMDIQRAADLSAIPLILNGAGDQYNPSGDSSPNGGALQGDGVVTSIVQWPGTVSLASNTAIDDYTEGTTLDITGAVSGSGNLAKIGPGTVILDDNNSYTGGTNITDGVLVADYSSVLLSNGSYGDSSLGAGATDAGTSVSGTGTLTLADGVDIQNESLTLAGIGFGGSVANSDANFDTNVVDNVTNNFSALHSAGHVKNIWAGPIHLDAPSQMNVDHNGTLLITGMVDGLAADTLTIGKFAAPTGSNYVLPDGTVELTQNNTYAGATVVNVGTLEAANTDALGSGTFDPNGNANTTTVNYKVNNAGVTYAGTLELTSNGQPSLTYDANESLVLNGPGILNEGALYNVSGSNVWPGPISLATSASIGAASGSANSLTINGMISDPYSTNGNNSAYPTSNLTKVDPGTVILAVANIYAGNTTVSAGNLTVENSNSLGAYGTTSNGTTVSSGATLQLNGGSTALTFGELLTLNGTGVGGLGALRSSGSNNTWNGQITLSTTASVQVDPGLMLKTGGSPITGAGGLTKIDGGTLNFTCQSANNYTGNTTIQAGTLSLGVNGSAPNYGISSGAKSTITINSGATLSGNGGIIAGMITNSGTLSFSGNLTGNLTNSGTLAGSGNFSFGSVTNTGTFNFSGYLSYISVTNSGTFDFNGALTIDIDLNQNQTETGQFVNNGGVVNLSGTLSVYYSGSTAVPSGYAIFEGVNVADVLFSNPTVTFNSTTYTITDSGNNVLLV